MCPFALESPHGSRRVNRGKGVNDCGEVGTGVPALRCLTSRVQRMVYEPTNQQISILCDIGQAAGEDVRPKWASDIEQLVQEGFLERAPNEMAPSLRYRLTAKAEKFLSDRGVGLNEA
jgi:hypothetical protein